MSRIEEIVNIANHIPPFPKVAMQVMKMLDDPAVQAKDLAEVIQYDSAITANILKTCNAAYFGLPRKVSALDDALVLMGQDALKDILIASSSARFYKGGAGEGYQLEQGELWKHSVAVAIMSKLISCHFEGIAPGTAFTAGLLHDIGKRFLSSFVASDFKKIMDRTYIDGLSFMAAEHEILGMDHAELGSLILQKWDFGEDMIQAVKMHHDPQALDKDPLIALVAMANTLVISLGIGVGADGLSGAMQGQGLKRFGITALDLDRYMSMLFMEMERAEDLMGLSN
ncbi:MAG: HDOD domain-containing protein [Proteobacteria bacterium]|nr:HDOD domain-containing protein [Desulfobulbaceae bacterium]MBU4153182.1 HDOD domain-containing protein [Pseudomonadota bacterium]